MIYRIFNTTVQSDFPLPELPESSDHAHSISIKLGEGEPGQLDRQAFEVAFEWRMHDETVVCSCERSGDDYLFIFPGSAAFHIACAGVISCYLQQGSSMQMMRHLLLNQVVPRYLATMGRLVLHAGAVTLENGKTVAFLGNSGFGKSTLVSSFLSNGARLINDDCVLLDFGESGVTVIGGLVGIRLFPDSVNAVFSETEGFANYTPHTDKQQLFLKDQLDDVSQEPRVLDALFLLNDPVEGAVDAISISPVSGPEAMLAMIYSAFSLDPSDKKTIANNFRNVGQAMDGQLGLYSLQYPREHGKLAKVRDAVSRRVGNLLPTG